MVFVMLRLPMRPLIRICDLPSQRINGGSYRSLLQRLPMRHTNRQLSILPRRRERTASRGQDHKQNRPLSLLWCSLISVQAFLGLHIFVSYFYSTSPTYGISMVPTIAPDLKACIISKYYRRGRGVQVGDIVSFNHPLRTDCMAIKRVIGLEGDYVVRDTPLQSQSSDQESGLEKPQWASAMIQVPQGHAYVVGDNLLESRDSRTFGPLPLALIRGKVIWTLDLWPRRIQSGLVEAQDVSSADNEEDDVTQHE